MSIGGIGSVNMLQTPVIGLKIWNKIKVKEHRKWCVEKSS